MDLATRFAIGCLCGTALVVSTAGAQTRRWAPAGFGGSGLFPVVAVDLLGIYVTTDSGQSWREVVNLQGSNGQGEPVVKCLEVDPTTPARIFMGMY